MHQVARHPGNRNLTLFYAPTFKGYPVLQEKGPLVREYLDALCWVIERTRAYYGRVFAARVDLRLPQGYEPLAQGKHRLMSRFWDSFKAKTRHDRDRARFEHGRARDTVVRFVWAREEGVDGRPHYHLLILLNGHAYNWLGSIQGHDNLIGRIQSAWASALMLSHQDAVGLVHVPDNAVYRLYPGDEATAAALFERGSYLCKAGTKVYGNGEHAFGYSRK